MSVLIYGSYGYTGALIAEEAARRGLPAVLAGRDPARLEPQARALGLDYRVFDLEDLRLVRENVRDARAVLHCAGPFARTAAPMARACLDTGTHYLDLTGEIAVFEALAELDDEARSAGVMLLPGAGFDVVPSDCLAAHLAARLPGARELTLAVSGFEGISHGTATTMLAGLGRPGAVRKGGRLVPVPVAHRTLRVDFGEGPRLCVAMPWGDLATAPRSTGILDVETYLHLPAPVALALRAARPLAGLLRRPWLRRALQARVDAAPAGPDAAARRRGRARLWGRVRDENGASLEARLETPEPYRLTMLAALHLAEKVLDGCAPAGFQTPSLAYGPGLAQELDGVAPFR